jgi:DNA polymerase I
MKVWIYDVWSRVERGVETAHLVALTEDNKVIELIDDSIRPFLLAEMVAQKYCVGEPVIKRVGIEDIELLKIEGEDATEDIPKMVAYLRRMNIKTWESDIYYTQVYMKERGITPCCWHNIFNAEYQLKRGFYYIGDSKIEKLEDDYSIPDLKCTALDIETFNPHGIPDVNKDPIILSGLLHRDENKDRARVMVPAKGIYDDVLLVETSEVINDFKPNFIVTYNGNAFDWDYIIQRSKLNGIKMRIGTDNSMPHVTEYQTIAVHGRPTIDLFGMAKFIVPKGSRKTQPIVHGELKKSGLAPESTVFYEIERDRIAKLWVTKKGREDVIKHCESDVEMTMDIFEYAIGFIIELSRLTNLPPDEVLSVSYSILVEAFLIQVAHNLNVAIPRVDYRQLPKSSGGITVEPKRGLLENVACFDFHSMYPHILVDNNIGTETFVHNPKLANILRGDYHVIQSDLGKSFYFLKYPKAFLAIAMGRLLEKVKQAKIRYKGRKYKQKYAGEVQAIKTIARVIYGYLKTKKSRWYLAEGQEAVASEGRNQVTKAIIVAEQNNIQVDYGDTDSIFVEGVKQKEAEEFADVLTEALGAGVGFDHYFKIMFFTGAKKMYAGLDENDELVLAGFTKSDWTELANMAQTKILDIVLREHDFDKAKKYVQFVERGIRLNIFPLKKFIVWKKPSKPIEEYPPVGSFVVRKGKRRMVNPPAHIVVARRNPSAFIEEDGTIGYVIGNNSNGTRLFEKALSYKEVKGVEELDKEYYIRNQLYSVADRVLEYFFGKGTSLRSYSKL